MEGKKRRKWIEEEVIRSVVRRHVVAILSIREEN